MERKTEIKQDKQDRAVVAISPTAKALITIETEKVATACMSKFGALVASKTAGQLMPPTELAQYSMLVAARTLLEKGVTEPDKTRKSDFLKVEQLDGKDRVAKGTLCLKMHCSDKVAPGKRILIEEPLAYVSNRVCDSDSQLLGLVFATMTRICKERKTRIASEQFAAEAEKWFLANCMVSRRAVDDTRVTELQNLFIRMLLVGDEVVPKHAVPLASKSGAFDSLFKSFGVKSERKTAAPMSKAEEIATKFATKILSLTSMDRKQFAPALSDWLKEHGLLRQDGGGEMMGDACAVLANLTYVATFVTMYAKDVLSPANHRTDGVALYRQFSAVNHSCVPNCNALFDPRNGMVVLYSSREIMSGEEITVSYFIDLLERYHEKLRFKLYGINDMRRIKRATIAAKSDGKSTAPEFSHEEITRGIDFVCGCDFCKLGDQERAEASAAAVAVPGMLSGLEDFPEVREELDERFADFNGYMDAPDSLGLALDAAVLLLDGIKDLAFPNIDLENLTAEVEKLRVSIAQEAEDAADVKMTVSDQKETAQEQKQKASADGIDTDADGDLEMKVAGLGGTAVDGEKPKKKKPVEKRDLAKERDDVSRDIVRRKACQPILVRMRYYLAGKIAALAIQMLNDERDAKDYNNGNLFTEIRALKVLETLDACTERSSFATDRGDLIRNGVICLAINAILSQWVDRGFSDKALALSSMVTSMTPASKRTVKDYIYREFMYLQPYIDHYRGMLLASCSDRTLDKITKWIVSQTLNNPKQALLLTTENVEALE